METDKELDSKRRHLLTSAKKIIGDSQSNEMLRRMSNQEHTYMTSKEIETIKHKILSLSYRLGKADLGGMFDRMDRDRSGSIDISELSFAIKRILPTITKQQLINLMNSADTDNNGTMERDEFIEFISNRESETQFSRPPGAPHDSSDMVGVKLNINRVQMDKAQLRLLHGSPLRRR